MTAQPLLNIHLGGTLAHTYRIAAGLGKFHSLRPIRNETAFHDTTIHIENHQASAKLSLIFFMQKKNGPRCREAFLFTSAFLEYYLTRCPVKSKRTPFLSTNSWPPCLRRRGTEVLVTDAGIISRIPVAASQASPSQNLSQSTFT